MLTQVNYEVKGQLAKLLATENIEVQENQVQTASFDVVNRILTIPIFKEEHKSKHVYDMLVGHEVSHALHTPSDGWMNMKDRSKEFRSFVNVIEDARIDKLIQKKYPGLTKDYLLGFKKMYKDNFFGTKGKDLQNDYTLIDKINMYFKSSRTLDFNFNKKELSLKDLKSIPYVGIEGPLSEKLYSFFDKNNFALFQYLGTLVIYSIWSNYFLFINFSSENY